MASENGRRNLHKDAGIERRKRMTMTREEKDGKGFERRERIKNESEITACEVTRERYERETSDSPSRLQNKNLSGPELLAFCSASNSLQEKFRLALASAEATDGSMSPAPSVTFFIDALSSIQKQNLLRSPSFYSDKVRCHKTDVERFGT